MPFCIIIWNVRRARPPAGKRESMRPALRDDIVETARKLFNESSYGSVSMRDISEALHISVGNLTYYFRKKQDILRAIMEKNFRNTAVTEQVHTFRQFNELLRKMLESLSVNAFYFRDPSVYGLNEGGSQDVNALYEIMMKALISLEEKGLLMNLDRGRKRESIVRVLMLSHLGWIQQSPTFRSANRLSEEEFLNAHWVILEPYFTETGKKEYEKLCEDKG